MSVETQHVEPDGAPTRARAGAAVLNATGLGLGYDHLGHRVRAGVAAVVTVGLVVLAIAVGTDGRPWLWPTLVVGWVALTLCDAWRLAGRPGPRPRRLAGRWRPVVVGVVLLAVLSTGLGAYTVAARSEYAEGVAAQVRGDCAAAGARFDTVAGLFALALSGDVRAAETGRVECAAYVAARAAQQRAAQQRAAYPEAVARLRDIRRIHPDTALAPVVQRDLLRAYTDWAGSLRNAGEHPAAIEVYREQLVEFPVGSVAEQAREDLAATHVELAAAARQALSPDRDRLSQVRPAVDALLTVAREFADTASAATVARGIVDVVTAADATVPADAPCAALPVLDHAAALTGAGTGDAVAVAAAARVPRRLDCGIVRFRAGEYPAAAGEFERLLADHPDSPQAAQARSALIASRIGEEHVAPVALPGPDVGDETGDNVVTVYNDSPTEVLVRLSGPTAHEFTLPPCPECPATYADPADACPTFDGRPSYTLRLAPGSYAELISSPADTSIEPMSSTSVVDQGYDYTECLHVERSDPYPSLPFLPRLPELAPVEPVAPR